MERGKQRKFREGGQACTWEEVKWHVRVPGLYCWAIMERPPAWLGWSRVPDETGACLEWKWRVRWTVCYFGSVAHIHRDGWLRGNGANGKSESLEKAGKPAPRRRWNEYRWCISYMGAVSVGRASSGVEQLDSCDRQDCMGVPGNCRGQWKRCVDSFGEYEERRTRGVADVYIRRCGNLVSWPSIQ